MCVGVTVAVRARGTGARFDRMNVFFEYPFVEPLVRVGVVDIDLIGASLEDEGVF